MGFQGDGGEAPSTQVPLYPEVPPPYGGPPPPGYSQIPSTEQSPLLPPQHPQIVVVGAPITGVPVLLNQFYPAPIPGIPLEAPVVDPQPGEVIIGYQTGRSKGGCCKCETLSAIGWFMVVLMLFVCWPLAFLVCCMPAMHQVVQRPVYGSPIMTTPPV